MHLTKYDYNRINNFQVVQIVGYISLEALFREFSVHSRRLDVSVQVKWEGHRNNAEEQKRRGHIDTGFS